jgi:hypothetical protein
VCRRGEARRSVADLVDLVVARLGSDPGRVYLESGDARDDLVRA